MAQFFQIRNKTDESYSDQVSYNIEWVIKNILVTGSNGQLGNELRLLAGNYPQFRFLFTDIEELDITNKEAISTFIRTNDIHYIINCAAYTAVDKAEEDEALCFRINHEAVENLAQAATGQGAKLLHVSTDYVFDGTSQTPYRETDPVAPQTVYGRSKLAGEKAALRDCPECVIVRTAWLYSSFGNNFVKTMIRLGKEKTNINVVSDQLGSPTYAADLAKALLTIVSEAENNNFIPGIYHFTDEGKCSWYDFAKTIHRFYGIETCDIHPVSSEEYPAKAKRPHYSVLNKQKIKTTFSVVVPHWEESLQHCIGKLKKEGF